MPQTAPNLHVSQHPAVRHKLGILRSERTEPKKFREVVRELSWLLGYEALADAKTRSIDVPTPLEVMAGEELADDLAELLRLGLLVAQDAELVQHRGVLRDVQRRRHRRGEHRSAS